VLLNFEVQKHCIGTTVLVAHSAEISIGGCAPQWMW